MHAAHRARDRPPRPEAGQHPARRATARRKITDFGLAKRLDGRRRPDADAAPSWARRATWPPSRPRARTARSARPPTSTRLGAILYELLTGRPPFRGDDARGDAAAGREPTSRCPPRRLQPKLPRDLETICLKCLEKEPGTALRHGRGPGRRPARVPRRRADPGPARRPPRAGPAMGAAEARVGGDARRRDRRGHRPRGRNLAVGRVGRGGVAVLGLIGGGSWYHARLQSVLRALSIASRSRRNDTPNDCNFSAR